MAETTLHILYLRPEAMDDRWSYLHRFFHPGTLEHNKRPVITCASLDMTHHVFLSLRAKNFAGKGTKTIHLRYDFVDAILEVSSHKSQLGFVDPTSILGE